MPPTTTEDKLQFGPLGSLTKMAQEGKGEFDRALNAILIRSNPSLATQVRRRTNSAQDPFLFSFFTSHNGQREATLDQLIARFIWDADPTQEITVLTNNDGVAFMPKLGYLESHAPHSRITIPASAQLNPINYLKDSIESLDHYVPLLNQFFGNQASQIQSTIGPSSAKSKTDLSNALNTMERVWPEFYEAITSVLQRVVTFRSGELNSFAHNAAPGVVFINLDLGNTEAFFLEDLAHQGGHVLLAAATYDQSAFFSEAPDCKISSWTGDEEDERTIYVGLHGLTTEAFMSILLSRCLAQHALRIELTNEVKARLSFIYKRFTTDLSTIGTLPIYNSRGAVLIEHFKRVWAFINATFGNELAKYDMSNQDYNFSYSQFMEINGHHLTRTP